LCSLDFVFSSKDYIPQKSMAFRDTILSDHEWSDDDDDDDDIMNEEFDDHDDDDEISINDLSNKISERTKSSYRVRISMNSNIYFIILQDKLPRKLFSIKILRSVIWFLYRSYCSYIKTSYRKTIEILHIRRL
jgi:hypothetical protein